MVACSIICVRLVKYDDTLIVFISDNGPSRTSIQDYLALGGEGAQFFKQFDNSLDNKGSPGSSTDIGPGWAYAAATPLRLFKGLCRARWYSGACGDQTAWQYRERQVAGLTN